MANYVNKEQKKVIADNALSEPISEFCIIQSRQKTKIMEQQTMAPTMIPNNAHKKIPGNPSTATSSTKKLNDRSNGEPLRVLQKKTGNSGFAMVM